MHISSLPRFTFKSTSSAHEFVDSARPFLRADPISSTLIATLCAQVFAGFLSLDPDTTLFVTVYDAHSSAPVGVFMIQGRPFGIVSRMPKGAGSALAEFVHSLSAPPSSNLERVDGSVACTMEFAARWAELIQKPHNVVHRDEALVVNRRDFYDALKLTKWAGIPANPTFPTDYLLETLCAWWDPFHIEAMPDKKTIPVSRSFLETAIEARQITMWVDEGRKPVSFCLYRQSFEEGGVARVGPVYTPPEERGKRYGIGCTAEGTRRAFEEGKAGRVMLFVAHYNPVGRHMYEKLGYKEEDRRVWIRFG
ncbi:hypothetical protein BJ742DRAFT_136437 [Cladochytrium replicatum]|nr:hypothetical protein BJ742DRAFT_136437 [Cladochytrium replicatum]